MTCTHTKYEGCPPCPCEMTPEEKKRERKRQWQRKNRSPGRGEDAGEAMTREEILRLRGYPVKGKKARP